MNDIKELAKWLKDEVEFLKANQEYVGGWYDLGNGLAATVLWEDGWGDEARDDAIQSEANPDWALCAGVMVINKDDTPDGWFMPWDSKTGDLLCETTGITPNEDYEKLASWLLGDFNRLKGADIKSNGETIFGEPEREPEAPVETPEVEEESCNKEDKKSIKEDKVQKWYIKNDNHGTPGWGYDDGRYYDTEEEAWDAVEEMCTMNPEDYGDVRDYEVVSTWKNESCKKPIKEENEIHNSPYKDIIAEYFDYSGDMEFLDIVASCLERVEDFEDDEDIYRAIDDELIYTYDQWKVIEHYCTPQEANWDSAYSDFMSDIFAICSRIAGMNNKEDDLEEPEEGEED